jgi:GGDEF domain-containing protein
MTTTVNLPDGTQLNFPDGMDNQSMQSAIYTSFPQYAPKPAPSFFERTQQKIAAAVAPTSDVSVMDQIKNISSGQIKNATAKFNAPDSTIGFDQNGISDTGTRSLTQAILNQSPVRKVETNPATLEPDYVAPVQQSLTPVETAYTNVGKILDNAKTGAVDLAVPQNTEQVLARDSQNMHPTEKPVVTDIGNAIAETAKSSGRSIEDLYASLGGGMHILNQDYAAGIVADNMKAGDSSYRATRFPGKVVENALPLVPAVASFFIPGVGEVLGSAMLAAQFGWGSGKDAIDQGKSVGNAQLKTAEYAVLGTSLGGLVTGGATKALSIIPGIGKAFVPAAADTVGQYASRMAQGAAGMAAFVPVGTAINQGTDVLTGQSGKPEDYQYMPTVDQLMAGALLPVPHATRDFVQRNTMPEKYIGLPNGDTAMSHSYGALFSSEDAANSFIESNGLTRGWEPQALTVSGNKLGFVVKAKPALEVDLTPKRTASDGSTPLDFSQPEPSTQPPIPELTDAVGGTPVGNQEVNSQMANAFRSATEDAAYKQVEQQKQASIEKAYNLNFAENQFQKYQGEQNVPRNETVHPEIPTQSTQGETGVTGGSTENGILRSDNGGGESGSNPVRQDQQGLKTVLDAVKTGTDQVSNAGQQTELTGRRNHIESVPPELDQRSGLDQRHDEIMRMQVAHMTPEELRHTILHDELTDLPNLRNFNESPVQAIVGFGDVNGLKGLNDTHGHPAGDALIAATGHILKKVTISTGGRVTFYRRGGDEFLVYGPDEKAVNAAIALARRELKKASFDFQTIDGQTGTQKGISIAFGIGKDVASAEVKMKADKARQKANGAAARGELSSGLSLHNPVQDATNNAIDALAQQHGVSTTPVAPIDDHRTQVPAVAKLDKTLRIIQNLPEQRVNQTNTLPEPVEIPAKNEQVIEQKPSTQVQGLRPIIEDMIRNKVVASRPNKAGQRLDLAPAIQRAKEILSGTRTATPAEVSWWTRTAKRFEGVDAPSGQAARAIIDYLKSGKTEIQKSVHVYPGESTPEILHNQDTKNAIIKQVQLDHPTWGDAITKLLERADNGQRGGLVIGSEKENLQRAAEMLAQKNGTTVQHELDRLSSATQQSITVIRAKTEDEAHKIASAVGGRVGSDLQGWKVETSTPVTGPLQYSIAAYEGLSPEEITTNPSSSKLLGLLNRVEKAKRTAILRGLVDDAGNLHVWAAHDAIHPEGAKASGIPYDYTKRVVITKTEGLPYFSFVDLGINKSDLIRRYGNNEVLFDVPGKGIATGAEYAKQENIKSDKLLHDLRIEPLQYSKNQMGFYSQLKNAIDSASDKIFTTGQQVKSWLDANAGKLGVKKDEIYWSGLTEYLEMNPGKITKQAVKSFLQIYGNVEVKEVTLGGFKNEWEILSEHTGKRIGGTYPTELAARRAANDSPVGDNPIVNQVRADNTGGAPKYYVYQLPGGENYKELLLTLPEKNDSTEKLKDALDKEYRVHGNSEHYDELLAQQKKIRDENKNFTSQHFNEKNILVHIRFNERTDANGKKVLFIEEIQSDWGQKGKKEGFVTDGKLPTDWTVHQTGPDGSWYVLDKSNTQVGIYGRTREEAIATALNPKGYTGGVSNAPFVTDTKSWTTLALKRMIIYAAENGYDKIAWTTGEQQVDRYNLAHQLQKITAIKRGDTFQILGIGTDGQSHNFGDHTVAELPNVVGKELAEKIANQEMPNEVYAGNDLKIGGEGMKGYYDQIVPQVANEILKKVGGGKVEPVGINTRHEGAVSGEMVMNQWHIPMDQQDRYWHDMTLTQRYTAIHAFRSEKDVQPGFVITPELRTKIQSEGLPLFSKQNTRTPGFYSPELGTAFVNHDEVSVKDASAIILHEMTHSADTKTHPTDTDGRMTIIGKQVVTRMNTPGVMGLPVYARVWDRLVNAGETNNPREALNYLVEETLNDAKRFGYSRLDKGFMGWLQRQGFAVSKPVKEWVANIRAAMYEHGISVKVEDLTVDDMIAAATRGMKRVAEGKQEVAGLENKAILNVGLDIPGGGKLNPEDVRSSVEKLGVKVLSENLHQSDTEMTSVLRLSRPLTKDEVYQLAVEHKQDAIAQRLPNGTGFLAGPKAADWGDYNPEYFKMPNGKSASESNTIQGSERGSKPGEISVTGVHYGKKLFSELSGKFFGTAGAGAERDWLNKLPKDDPLQTRLAFYVNEGNGTFPELQNGVGHVPHEVPLNNLYDVGSKLIKTPVGDYAAFEHEVLKQGYSGYYIKNAQGVGKRQQGVAVLLGDAAKSLTVPSQIQFSKKETFENLKTTVDDLADRVKSNKSMSTVSSGISGAWDGIQRAFAPQYRSPEAREVSRILIEGLGTKEMEGIRFRAKLNNASKVNNEELTLSQKARDIVEKGLTVAADKVFLRNSKEENYAFMQAMDTGDSAYFSTRPELKSMAYVMGKMFYDKAREVQSLGTGALETIRENYFPHIWNREPSGDTQRQIMTALSKRPFEGQKDFVKARIFDDFNAGIKAGLEPVSDNPLDLVLLKMEEMDKYILAHKTLRTIAENSDAVTLIGAGDKKPAGYEDVNGRFGFITIGNEKLRYVARDDVAQVINNYLSPNLYHNKYVGKLYTGGMSAANTLNQFQLGVFSAFHAGFTSFEAVISHAAVGIKALSGGDFKAAAHYIGTAPAAWINNPKMGDRIIKEMLTKGSHPEMAQIIEGLQLAGFKWQMDTRLRTDSTKRMIQAWGEGRQIVAAAHSLNAVVEQSARPILEWLVPRQKFGVFGEMYNKWIQDNPNASHEELRNSAQQIWNRVDSRLGQVVYTRLFMHNVTKNFGQLLLRAPGWTGGTILEVGGGMKDLALYAKDVATGKNPGEISDRAAYTLSMLLVTSISNALLTTLFTGSAPKDWKDLVAFRTGNVDEHGRPERFMLPTYMKDVYAYAHDPVKTLLHKTHPLLSVVSDIARNRDYYGTEIRSEDDGLLRQLGEAAGYVAGSFVPFWMKGVQKEHARGGSLMTEALPLVGVMPAPSDINKSRAEILMSEYSADRLPQGTRTRAQAEKAAASSEIYSAIRKNDIAKAQKLFAEDQAKGILTAQDYRKIAMSSGNNYFVNTFKKLTYEQAVRVMAVATPTEQKELAFVFARKRATFIQKGGRP